MDWAIKYPFGLFWVESASVRPLASGIGNEKMSMNERTNRMDMIAIKVKVMLLVEVNLI